MNTPPVPRLAPSFSVSVVLGTLEDHGRTSAGHRRVIPIVGGTITGDLDAQILPGGADWQMVRLDGTIDIDARYSARTDEGELLYLQTAGVRSGFKGILEALLRGDPVSLEDYYFRTLVTIETAAPRLSHLQTTLFIASCLRDAHGVRYDTYRVH